MRSNFARLEFTPGHDEDLADRRNRGTSSYTASPGKWPLLPATEISHLTTGNVKVAVRLSGKSCERVNYTIT